MTKSFYRVSSLIYVTEAKAEALQEQVQRLLCPDPDHTPPCPIPWETAIEPVDGEQDTTSLRQQLAAKRNSS